MKKFLLLVCVCIGNFLYAQERCGTTYNPSSMSAIQQQNVESFYKAAEISAKSLESQSATLNSFNATSGTVLVPVVVHIVHNTTAQNISDAQICSQIEVLNEDFARRNADRTLTPTAFAGIAANTDIQFYLATRDPNGNATTGITRTATTRTSFSSNNDIKSSSTGGRSPWDTNRYLNIWVANLSGGLLGYAQFPWDFASKPNTDGVVVKFDAFGRTGTLNSRYNRGRTTTHEVGHWLGLRHIWGDDGTACTGSDGVSDTPNQGGPYTLQCPTGNRTTCSSNDMYMNYMDYTDDACMNMFSNGQKAVMRATLNAGGYRQNFSYFLPAIAGAKSVCTTSKSYTLQNVPAGVNASWTVSPTSLVATSSGTGTTASIRAASSSSSGQATITFTIRGGNSCTATTVTRTIQVGKFTTSQITVSGTVDVCPGNAYNYTANVPGGHDTGYTYSWTYPSGWSVYSQSTNTIRLYVPSGNSQYGTVRVTVNNGCGATGPTGVTVFPGYSCGGFLTSGEFTIYPNPASEQLTIEQGANTVSVATVNSQESSTQTNELFSPTKIAASEFKVELLNGQQVVVATGTAKGKKVLLDTKALAPGTYYLQIYYDKRVNREQIIIQ